MFATTEAQRLHLFSSNPLQSSFSTFNEIDCQGTSNCRMAICKGQFSVFIFLNLSAAFNQVESFFLRHVLHLMLRTPLLAFLLSVSLLVLSFSLTSKYYWTLWLSPWSSSLSKLTPLVISHGFKYHLCDVNSQVKNNSSLNLFSKLQTRITHGQLANLHLDTSWMSNVTRSKLNCLFSPKSTLPTFFHIYIQLLRIKTLTLSLTPLFFTSTVNLWENRINSTYKNNKNLITSHSFCGSKSLSPLT